MPTPDLTVPKPGHLRHRRSGLGCCVGVAVLGAVVNLALYWNSERVRRSPSARWRLRPPTRKERIGKWIQLSTSILTLVLVLVELLTHPHSHHEI